MQAEVSIVIIVIVTKQILHGARQKIVVQMLLDRDLRKKKRQIK